jgi:hypothetical protein
LDKKSCGDNLGLADINGRIMGLRKICCEDVNEFCGSSAELLVP